MRSNSLARKVAKAAVFPTGILTRRAPGDVTILLYHRVGVRDREIDLPLDLFERQLASLTARHLILSLDEALGDPGSGGVVVTFDDGYRDFHSHVLPVLLRYHVPATLYLATGLVSNGAERGGRDSLDWTQLREAVDTGLVGVGSHTHGHVDLSHASEEEANEEMLRSKELIEDHLGTACVHFAYPWSVGSTAAERVARRLFRTAAIEWGTNRRGYVDPYRLRRVPVLQSDGRLFFRAKVAGMLDNEALVYRAFRRGPWRPR